MIADFSVENFYSIRTKQTLSFVPTIEKYLSDTYLVEVTPNVKLLRLGIVYGANASGKTKLLQALDFFRKLLMVYPSSRTDAIIELAEVGLSSLRASLNSARSEVYERYYRPHGYSLDDVRRSMKEASKRGVHVAINLLYFPGVTDTELEMEALCDMVNECGVHLIQLRNLNIDPEWYPTFLKGIEFGPSAGLINFQKRLKNAKPDIEFGYFNPWVPEKK